MEVIGSVLVFMALGWASWLFYSMVIGSRRRARAQIKELHLAGFNVDYVLKGNIYVLFDNTKKKIAFVFSDKSSVYDYGDIKSISRYWLTFPRLKLKNTMVFVLHGKKIRCGNLSTRQAEYWHPRLVELIAA